MFSQLLRLRWKRRRGSLGARARASEIRAQRPRAQAKRPRARYGRWWSFFPSRLAHFSLSSTTLPVGNTLSRAVGEFKRGKTTGTWYATNAKKIFEKT